MVQTAALAAPAGTLQAAPSRLAFDAGSAALSALARSELERVAATLVGNRNRLQVYAFASGHAQNTSAARRLSLSRGLAVRSFLIDKGIRSTRIDVRAVGTPDGATDGTADRVDLVLATR